ncbi:MAG: hypothetical protein QOJ11_361 [Frankiales bacterium]|nr:hypothetical protein [Frankiales bacterium]
MVPDTPPFDAPTVSRRRFGLALVFAVVAVAGAGVELYFERGGSRKVFRAVKLAPSQVLDLSIWKIGLPTTKEIKQPQLETYSDASFSVVSAVQFTARCGDVAQAGSKYARSELREMNHDGSQASWSTTSGTHIMSLTQTITHLPVKKPQLICGQIHNSTDYLIMVEIDGTNLYVRNRDATAGVLDAKYRLGTPFDLQISVNGGLVTVTYNGVEKAHIPLLETGCYFKAGCYVQSNTASGDLPTAYGQVEISRLDISHT